MALFAPVASPCGKSLSWAAMEVDGGMLACTTWGDGIEGKGVVAN
jgi:hypothetical protein